MRVYFDNASTTPIYPEVAQHMVEILTENYGNPSSIHGHGRKARSIIEAARKIIAKAINASVGEVFFTSSATEATNTILHRAVVDLGITRIISSPTEHHCVLHTLDRLESEFNIEVIYLTTDDQGQIDLDQLEEICSSSNQKSLVSLMYGNNEIGTITDIARVNAIAEKYNVLFHCDAVQALGKTSIDVQKTKMNFLTGSGHKFHGPKGIGFFYMANNSIIKPFILGGAQERNMRAGTENVAGIAGMAHALQISLDKMENTVEHLLQLRNHFESRLKEEIADIKVNGENALYRLPNVSSISFPPSSTAEMMIFNLDLAGVSASSGSACSSGIEQDSHVLVAIKHPSDRKSIRFSFSVFNTLEEVDYVVEKLKQIVPVHTIDHA